MLHVWSVLASLAALIGCRSFSSLPTTTTRLRTIHRKHHIRVDHLFPLSSLHSTKLFPAKTPNAIKLRSSIATDCESNIDFVSADSDINVDDGSCDDKKEKAVGLYIHIPYCRQRCRYCDFAIVPIGDLGSNKSGRSNTADLCVDEDNPDVNDPEQNTSQLSRREQGFRRMNDRYVSAIVTELKRIAYRNANQKSDCQKVPLRSIYFGGGTPSLAPIESIENILYHACGKDNPDAPFRLLQQPPQHHPSKDKTDEAAKSENAIVRTEITMEMDPGTFDREYLSSLRGLGVNRVSLGVQSFDDDLLRAMGRTHRRADVLQAICDIAFVFGGNKNHSTSDNGWDDVNYSIDLISGCPGLTPAKWVETLQEATAGVQPKEDMADRLSVDSSLATTIKRRSLLLSSLPPPTHISVYDMQIEEGTVFGKWAAKAEEEAAAKKMKGEPSPTTYEDEDEDPSRQFTVALPHDESGETSGKLPRESNPKQIIKQEQRLLRLPSEGECAFMYKYAAGYLRAKNYEHYEVSSYAAFNSSIKCQQNNDDSNGNSTKQYTRPTGKRSVHNQIYWEYDGQWYAVGLGATSFVDKKLVARPRKMNDYVEWVREGKECTTLTTSEEDDEEGDIDDEYLSDLLLKRLRTIDGLDLSWLETNYGSETMEEVLEGAKLGLELGLAEHTEDNNLRLTDPEGLLYSNFIISSIFQELGYT